MHIHILGICGTFMAGVAALAKGAGHRVTGSDANVYPPMSTQLKTLGIDLTEGYDPEQLEPRPDCVVVGNALSRGNAAVEATLNRGIPYTSGPQWLAEHVLSNRHVIAVAGTHGKTSTASMLAWILEDAGLDPGFLIGGVPSNFDVTARLGGSPFFVVEADEYDTAFFDKRAKFVHYRPRTLILNNLEFDHADIYKDLDAILWQFHQLLRTVPAEGRVLLNGADRNLQAAIELGCWSPVETFGTDLAFDWQAEFADAGERHIRLWQQGAAPGETLWKLSGGHNLENALAAVAAAHSAGVSVADAVSALSRFDGVKRRLERTATVSDVAIYDDFAHHPTAIRRTIQGLRKRHPNRRIVVALEPRSNTMKMGVHNATLAAALDGADYIAVFRPADFDAGFDRGLAELGSKLQLFASYDDLVTALGMELKAGDQMVFMSNGGFGAARQKLTMALKRGRNSAGSAPIGEL
jgi:UDP-N-acetylmuramate: L-alanyl-gamma-D-glutamyl-meso-diaminopimelate ligase